MVRDIRGLGLMIAVELRTKVAPVLKSLMLNHGVIALPAGPTVLRLLPPLVITEKEINLGVQAIAKAIKELRLRPDGLARRPPIELVRGLVAIPSLSRHEAAAASWLVEQMRAAGYDRAFVDEAGNAVGELGDPSASRTIVLLGHIDTVPGNIPVRIEAAAAQTAMCCLAAAALTRRGRSRRSSPAPRGSDQRRPRPPLSASSWLARLRKKPRPARARASSQRASTAQREPIPTACIIGEPSHWNRVTLGYKGRLLLDFTADQPMAHTAGPDASVASVVVDFWNWVTAHAARRQRRQGQGRSIS